MKLPGSTLLYVWALLRQMRAHSLFCHSYAAESTTSFAVAAVGASRYERR